ncbi:MAG: hypothetical protein RIS81_14 [Actinomycetota bacterium]
MKQTQQNILKKHSQILRQVLGLHTVSLRRIRLLLKWWRQCKPTNTSVCRHGNCAIPEARSVPKLGCTGSHGQHQFSMAYSVVATLSICRLCLAISTNPTSSCLLAPARCVQKFPVISQVNSCSLLRLEKFLGRHTRLLHARHCA